MIKIAVAIFWAAWCVAFYLLVKTLSRPDKQGRARWRNLITPTPVNAFPVHDKTQKPTREVTLPK
jgi:hypothetical protein